MRLYPILILTLCSPFAALAQTDTPPDEEKSTLLKEVVVTGDDVWVEGANKVVFRPKKSDKNLATDAASLVRNMNTGLLIVGNDGVIKARDGKAVDIYIRWIYISTV